MRIPSEPERVLPQPFGARASRIVPPLRFAATVRLAALVPLLALVACGGRAEAPAPRADLAGTWDLVTVDGAALPTSSPEEESVILESVTLTLDGGGAYALSSRFRLAGQAEASEQTISGTWEATDAALTFHSEQGPAVVEFGYSRTGSVIVLVDEEDHRWEMRRR